jgi:hypothetical protein
MVSLPKPVIPFLVIAALFGGYFLRTAFTQPTTAVSLGEGEGEKLVCIVDGVKCKGTARFFTSLYEDVAGITAIETYATEHRAIFTYDPDIITPDRIQSIMETPVLLNDGRRVQIFKCLSIEKK